MNEVTRIINMIEQGDAGASEKLLPLVYEELRILAAQKMAQERPGQTLQATALVHEAYIRLMGSDDKGWDSRGHFFKAAAEAMRRILIETARRKQTDKRGGGCRRVELGEGLPAGMDGEYLDELIALDDALERLAEKDPLKADLIKLRFYAGLTIEQSAKTLGISPTTAKSHWAYARAWLLREVG